MAGWRVGGVAGMARPGKQLSTGGKKTNMNQVQGNTSREAGIGQ